MENATSRTVKNVVLDNGGEFINKAFDSYLKSKGINHLKMAPYTPEKNPFAERSNRSVVEKARCLLKSSNLSLDWWAEAINTSVYLLNQTLSTAIAMASPYSIWFGYEPRLNHLRIFGS